MNVLGIDIGGTGTKAAAVDVSNGRLLTERVKVRTPQPATPEAVMATCQELITQLDWQGPIGCGFPAIMKDDVSLTANNVDPSWIGVNVADLLRQLGHQDVHAVNDADAAAICELAYGAAKGRQGIIMLVTIGTGIGCGLIHDGKLLPNCELGSAYMKHGMIAEHWASNHARKTQELDWVTFAHRLTEVLHYFQMLVGVDHFIIGGGLSHKFDNIADHMDASLSISTAAFHNAAGVIGAAAYAANRMGILTSSTEV